MKNAGLLVVGGPISSGKSVLVNSLPFFSINEINEEDQIQKILIEQTYSKQRVAAEVIEFYFLENRKEKYQNSSTQSSTQILDRSIFESLWFAQKNLSPKSFQHFNRLFEDTIKDLISNYGKPKLYILLDINWANFCERLFKRNRKEEITNFDKNKEFFQEHIRSYVDSIKKILKKYNVNYVVINTNNLSASEVCLIAQKFLEELVDEN